MQSDITILLNTRNSGEGGRPITPGGMGRLPGLMRKETKVAFKSLEGLILGRLRHSFEMFIRTKPRNPAYRKAWSRVLKQRLLPAYIANLYGNRDELKLVMFDARYADLITRNEGWRTGSRGWFNLFSDGHSGRKHGSQRYGFMNHELAMKLAHRAAEEGFSAKAQNEKALWLSEMDMVFQGKHNDPSGDNGIMVDLDKPLFFRFPKFGKAGKWARPHRGNWSWPALRQTFEWMRQSNGEVIKTIETAFLNAAEEIMK